MRRLAYVVLWCAAAAFTAGVATVWAFEESLWRRVQRALGA